MAEHRKFADTVVDENGNLHAVEAGPSEKQHGPGEVKHRKFDDTVVDENGNLHAVEGPGDMKSGQNVKHRKFADTVKDANGNLHAIPLPDVDFTES